MVNIQALIRQKKQQFFTARSNRSQLENERKAEELQQIQRERIRLEGKAKLEQAKQEELAKIRVAKEKAPSNLMRFGQGLAAVMNKGKEHLKKVKTQTGGIDFGGQRKVELPENRGIDFGIGAGSPFNASEKKKVPSNVFQK